MSIYYENTYRIDSRDVDPSDHCRPSAVLGILQEAATSAAVAIHVSRPEMLARYHVFWMLARIWYRLDRPLHWNEQVTVRTWHRGGKGAAMYRDFDLTMDGQRIGEAVSTWVLADQDTHKLFRISDVAEFEGTTGGALCKTKLLHRPKLPRELALSEHRIMRYSDCDINGHVNNAHYADFICDALPSGTLGSGRFVSTLQIGYLAECRPGEEIAIHTAQEKDSWYVHGVGGEGRARFDAALTLQDA